MKLSSPIPDILESIESNFNNQYKKVRENIALVAYSIIRCQNVNTAEIARHMNEVNDLDFKANDMKVYRLLSSKNFQVDDSLWRGYIRLFFKLIKKNGFDKTERFFLNVDYTTDTNNFLILCASMRLQGQSIPFYFSMRKYPKRPGMHDRNKLEEAFFRALRHLLPKGYQYTIVANHGFGNERIIELLEELDFDYVLRFNENLIIQSKYFNGNIKTLSHKNIQISPAFVKKWDREISLVKRVQEEQSWVLVISQPLESFSKTSYSYIYEGQFSIEKMFKNKKSGGIDLEILKIKKYDRFKRLLFISCVAYSIMIFSEIESQ